MAHHPELITQILEAGSHVDLSHIHSGFSSEHVTSWVKLAVERGGHLTVGIGYDHALYVQWAKVGGAHLTVRF